MRRMKARMTHTRCYELADLFFVVGDCLSVGGFVWCDWIICRGSLRSCRGEGLDKLSVCADGFVVCFARR